MRNSNGGRNEFLRYRLSRTRGNRGVPYGAVVLLPKKMARWLRMADLGRVSDRPLDLPRQAGISPIRRTDGCTTDTRVASPTA